MTNGLTMDKPVTAAAKVIKIGAAELVVATVGDGQEKVAAV